MNESLSQGDTLRLIDRLSDCLTTLLLPPVVWPVQYAAVSSREWPAREPGSLLVGPPSTEHGVGK